MASFLFTLLIIGIFICYSTSVQGLVHTSSITVQGKPIVLSGFENDIVYRHMVNTKEWDVDIIDLAKLLCPHGNETYFDIGANLGFMTIEFALLASRGRVFSWEPHPSNYMLLEKNVRDNNLNNVHIFNNAVSDEDMTLCIPRFAADRDIASSAAPPPGRKRPTNNGDIKLSDKGGRTTSCTGDEVPIHTMKLDFSVNALDFIKIDVQGYELRVLKTLLPHVLKLRPYIVIEFEEWNMRRMQASYSSIDIVNYIRNEMKYDVILIPSGYPVDHLLVPIEKMDDFRLRYGKSMKPLTKPNSVNRNVEAGVKEQICLVEAKCNSWKGMFSKKQG